MAGRLHTLVALGVVLLGCTEEPLKDTEHLRVVAVQAEPPTAAPGQSIELELLHSDLVRAGTSDAADSVQVAWIGGCHDPPGGRHLDCYPHARDAVQLYADRVYDTPPSDLEAHAGTLGLGTHFGYVAPELAGAFGVSYVFFAVCRGVLAPAPDIEDTVPLRCLDGDGNRLGRTDFEVGFAAIPVLPPGVGNQNPVIGALLVNGSPIESASCETDADCPAVGDPPVSQQCLALDDTASQCCPAMEPCTAESCPSVQLEPQLGAENAEPNPLAAAPGETPPLEVLTAEILTPWDEDDETFTWQDDGWDPAPRFDVEVPLDFTQESADVWFVVRDNRGGVAWNSWTFAVVADR